MTMRYLVFGKSIDMYNRSIDSLKRFVVPNKIIIYVLGEDMPKIRRKIDQKGVMFVCLDEIVSAMPSFRTWDMCQYRLVADCMFLSEKCVLVDADVLFFRRPDFIIDWWNGKSKTCFYIKDWQETRQYIANVVPDEPFPSKFNAGMVLKPQGRIDFKFCCTRLYQHPQVRLMNQYLLGVALMKKHKMEFLPDDYWCSGETPENPVAWHLVERVWDSKRKEITEMLGV